MPRTYYIRGPRDYNVNPGEDYEGNIVTMFLPPQLVIDRIPDTGRNLILSHPLVVSINLDDDEIWACHEPQLAIDGYGETYWSAINDFYREFLWLWDEIANWDGKLDRVARELKESMRAIVEEQKVEIPEYPARDENYRFSYTIREERVLSQEGPSRPREVSAMGEWHTD